VKINRWLFAASGAAQAKQAINGTRPAIAATQPVKLPASSGRADSKNPKVS
jgi:hypothetical protein